MWNVLCCHKMYLGLDLYCISLYVSLPFSIDYHVKPSNKLYTLYLCIWYCEHAWHWMKNLHNIHVCQADTMTSHFKHPINHCCNKAWTLWHDKNTCLYICQDFEVIPPPHPNTDALEQGTYPLYLLPLPLTSNSQLYEVNFMNMCQSVEE